MSEEVLLNVTPRETRIAMVENGVLTEVFIERASRLGLVGNIYKGKISRVLPGMQAAFVDIGLERTAFLHASDIHVPNNGTEEGRHTEDISKLVHQGQSLLVQVIKDPIGSKGARLCTQLSIAARYLVLMPALQHIGVSQKIEDEDDRNRLKRLTSELALEFGQDGYIIRTVAENATEKELKADMQFLQKLWNDIQEKSKTQADGTLVHEDLRLIMRTMRDQVGSGEGVEKIRIDSKENYEKIVKFANKFIPEVVSRIEYYPGKRPIFDLYGVEDEIQKALERKVELKSGGYLIIDQTEAMTTIDVNTGAFVGHRNLEETIFKTNLEATQAIVHQLRLRNLGGIIIIDFIDMSDPEHRSQVLSALERSLEQDKSKSYISEVSDLGLVEMTRKRTRESLEHVMCEVCPTCAGRGSIKSAETVCYEIFRELIREARQYDAQQFLVIASQEVVDLMVDEESNTVAELEEFIDKPIKFQVETMYNQEQYDVVLM
ncbi:MAG: ribonuclease G [Gammaproteobacteria bacterium]|nr:ribonuclease G [Gammaproteobacteria bacterium]MDH5799723.1 ribonuclease G [Gammaproteobacteria bacterium]